MSLKTIIKSLPVQFMIGGLTVAAIAFTSNNINNPALAGLIAANWNAIKYFCRQ